MPADTFANFSCEGHDCRGDLSDLTSGKQSMPSTDNMSLPDRVRAYARQAALAGASLGLVVSGTVAAAEPPVSVEYRSIFSGYRHFDPQPPAVEWRLANDAIRDGAEGDAHGMHDMRAPTGGAPTGTDEPQPTTPGDHQEHSR